MKKLLLSTALAVFFLLTVLNFSSQAFNCCDCLDLSVSLSASTAYLGSTSGKTLYDGTVITSNVRLTYDKYIYAKIFNAYSPKGGINSDYGDEIDFGIGTIVSLPIDVEGDFSYSYYNLYDMRYSDKNLHVFIFALQLPQIQAIRPNVTLEWDDPVNDDKIEGGFMYKANIHGDFNLPEFCSKVEQLGIDLFVLGHDGAFGAIKDEISTVGIAVEIPIKITENMELAPSIYLQKCVGHEMSEGGLTEDKVVGKLSLNF